MRAGGRSSGRGTAAHAVEAPAERQSAALLVLPFLLLALAIGVGQAFRPSSRLAGSIAWPAPGKALKTAAAASLRIAIRTRPPREGRAMPRLQPDASAPRTDDLPSARQPPAPPPAPEALPEPLATVAGWEPDRIETVLRADSVAICPAPREAQVVDAGPAMPATASEPMALPPPPAALASLPPRALARLESRPAYDIARSVGPPPSILALAAHLPAAAEAGICTLGGARIGLAAPAMLSTAVSIDAFGSRIAAAALAQTRDVVIYNDKYRRLVFPMGDVPALFGVCTDVVVRAFRAVGIDLQALVQLTGAGSGDANIDHRRTEVLRRFFTVQGASLPISDFAEDYRPGDIVTYHRPQNQHSRSHIAIVSDRLGPSGRPMIVHNRGWGPQLEDGLFVDQITGHYRFAGVRGGTPVAATLVPRTLAARSRLRGPVGMARSAPVSAAVAEQIPASSGSAALPKVR